MKKKKSIGANKNSSQKNFQICVYLLDYSSTKTTIGLFHADRKIQHEREMKENAFVCL